jgi:hypothetical protein
MPMFARSLVPIASAQRKELVPFQLSGQLQDA